LSLKLQKNKYEKVLMSKNNKSSIDSALVHQLISSQFPQWKDLTIRPVAVGGWDNRTFHLGDQMLVRLPSASEYVAQVEKEQTWLPKLAPFLPLPIPVPLATGKPEAGYPWKWSIYQWLEGESALSSHINGLCAFAQDLAQFLMAFHRIGPMGGPSPGPENFYRGGPLATYDTETRKAIAILNDKIDGEIAIKIWEAALATPWTLMPVWVHGDISPGNLLVKDGRLNAVIDFGQLAVGDPACDLAISWTFFDEKSREAFRSALGLDEGTWDRGRGWALWKALVVASGVIEAKQDDITQSWVILHRILSSDRTN
jgi:aminoglycoside phosphotransferase (APT) family kinase protein